MCLGSEEPYKEYLRVDILVLTWTMAQTQIITESPRSHPAVTVSPPVVVGEFYSETPFFQEGLGFSIRYLDVALPRWTAALLR